MTNRIIASLLFISLVSSCSETTTSAATAGKSNGSEVLYQSEWKLTEAQGQLVPAASKAMLSFAAGQINKVTGHTGCNRMNGTFDLPGLNSIKFSALLTTKMACLDENANKLETIFTGALAKADNWSIVNEQLVLKNGATVVAKLTAQKAAVTEAHLLNGVWELNYISGPKIAFEGLFPNKKPSIHFNFPAEEATGNGSCNGYSVKVKVDGNTIQFGDALSTMMACEGNGEPVYFKTLKTVTSYSVDENTLTLMTGDIAVLRFTKK